MKVLRSHPSIPSRSAHSRRIAAGSISGSIARAMACAIGAAALLIPAHAQGQETSTNSAIRLSGSSASAGGALSLVLRSPYPGTGCAIEALSPTRRPFTLFSGATDASGGISLSLNPLDVPGLEGANLSVRARLDGPENGKPMVSRWTHLRIGAGGPLEKAGFDLDVESLPADPAIAESARLADIDGDEDLDLILASAASDGNGTPLRVLLNDGSGVWTDESAARIPADSQLPVRFIRVADVNGDGNVDFLAAAWSDEDDNRLFLNDGAGSFTRDESFPAKTEDSTHANTALFADFNGDGSPDLFIGCGISAAHGAPPILERNELFLNDGAGRFTRDEEFALDDGINLPALTRGAAAGDVDLDGDLDLLIGRAGGNLLLLNDGAGRMEDGTANLPPAADSTYGAALEDIDLDGDLDVVYANTAFDPFAQAILLNQGGKQGGAIGEFAAADFPGPIEGQSAVRLGLHVADVDADGDIDILFPIHEFGSGEHPDLYLNQGGLQGGEAGTFLLDGSFEALSGVYSDIDSGDIDGDGDLDLVVPMGSSFTPETNPARTYLLKSKVFQAGDAPLAFRRGEVNRDGTVDLSDAIQILGFLFRGEAGPDCIAAADINGSGEVDVSDPISLLTHLFIGGASPAAPFPGFGDAFIPSTLTCNSVKVFEEQ